MESIIWWAGEPTNTYNSGSTSMRYTAWANDLVFILKNCQTGSFKEWKTKNNANIVTGYDVGETRTEAIYTSTVETYDGSLEVIRHVNLNMLVKEQVEFKNVNLHLPYEKLKLEICRIVHKTIKANYQKKHLNESTQKWMDKFK